MSDQHSGEMNRTKLFAGLHHSAMTPAGNLQGRLQTQITVIRNVTNNNKLGEQTTMKHTNLTGNV